jgi:membrane protease subunit (stomatin/prohibitin family)
VKLLSGVVQQAEVFYVQKKPFDGKFGSKQPYQFRDKEFGMVNLRLFGDFRYRVKDCSLFINQFVGTMNYHMSDAVLEKLREQMVLLLYDALGNLKERGMGVADLAANLTTIEQIVIQKSKEHFEPYGIELMKLLGLYITLPEEVQKAVDAKASMTVLGTDYMGYQTGKAIRDAAVNPSTGGGLAGAGVGFGAGMGMGAAMMGTMGQAATGGAGGTGAAATTAPCRKCGRVIQQDAKFCPSCGHPQVAGEPCIKCGKVIDPDAKFCPDCGAPQEGSCPGCGAKVDSDAKFCPKCGAKIDGQSDLGKKCVKCGREVPGGVKFCPNCGEKF